MPEYYIQKRLPRDFAEHQDLRKFQQMESQRDFNGGRIKPTHVKHYARVKTRLIKLGIIAPGTRDNIRGLAMEAYRAMPFYKQWWLKAKFHWKNFKSLFSRPSKAR